MSTTTDYGAILGLDLAAGACGAVADMLDAGDVTPAAALGLARWGIRAAAGPAEVDGGLYAGLRDLSRRDPSAEDVRELLGLMVRYFKAAADALQAQGESSVG
jgi:hypothetical protein